MSSHRSAKARGDDSEQVLKTIANATSYGNNIEVNRDDAPRLEPLDLYGPDGSRQEIESKALEDPGRYFNPLLAVLITGAARLMLGIAEKMVIDRGLDWAFCDTDSLAIVRIDGVSRGKFRRQVDEIIKAFESLNPYDKQESILKLEKVNHSNDSDVSDVLYCYAISAKRYALFNLNQRGSPVLRKASAHGLGHLVRPYGDGDDE